MTLSTYDHTEAIRTLLATAGYPVGLNQAPDASPPYFVLYPINSPEHGGSLADPDADWALQYQVTTVAVGPEQALDLADLARATLQGTPLAVTGRSIWRVEAEAVAQLLRDDTLQPPLHYCADTFTVRTTPS